MSIRATHPLLRLVVSALIAALAWGPGLPGLVSALQGASTHVCTCATGGSHASCPVCNRSLDEPRRPRVPVFDGVPCGDKHDATSAIADLGVLPVPRADLRPPFLSLRAPNADRLLPEDRNVEPATPPPRTASV